MSVNRVTLLGHLCRDPEIRRLNSGDPVCNLRLATSERWKDRETGERKERSQFHNIVIFNENLAAVCEKYLRKGSKIYVEGQLQTREYEKDGSKRYSTEVVLQRYRGELQMLDGKSEGGGDTPAYQDRNTTEPPANNADDFDSEIPF